MTEGTSLIERLEKAEPVAIETEKVMVFLKNAGKAKQLNRPKLLMKKLIG